MADDLIQALLRAVRGDIEPTRAALTGKSPRSRYTLPELLLQADYPQPRSAEDQAWLAAPPAGRELI
jgi:hypothetical protein